MLLTVRVGNEESGIDELDRASFSGGVVYDGWMDGVAAIMDGSTLLTGRCRMFSWAVWRRQRGNEKPFRRVEGWGTEGMEGGRKMLLE